MNYKDEEFPKNINDLIEKCEQTIINIIERFNDPNCITVGDLYFPERGLKQDDFLIKLQVSCNVKINNKVKKENELQGLYVFGEINDKNKVTPIYVGISRTVFRRLYQHTWGTKHNETTFSYLKAKHYNNFKGKREELPIELLREQQMKIKNYKLVVIPEMNHFDMYFMEVYIAGRLRTRWNSFKTH